MRRSSAALPALAAALLLAACSTQNQPPRAVVAGTPGAPPPAPSPLASPEQQRVEVTGSAIQSGAVLTYAPAPPAMYRMPPVIRLPGADKFPDVQANKSILVEEQPVSTFSTDVDTASYAFVRRQLNSGRMPPLASVRVEEMVNYFPYDYATPSSRTQPFALTTEVMPSPWKAENQLLHIAVRGFDIKAAQQPPMNVVLLVDVSGSMGPQDRLPLLKQGFRLFAERLRPQDRVAIVTYASGTKVALEPTTGEDKGKGKILDAIAALGAGGATAGADGLQRAYALAERHLDKGAVNRIILATDGDFNVGITDPRELKRFVADKRKSGIYLSILGVGSGNLNDALMQRLAQSGNGNAAYIDSLLEARKALGEELGSTMFPIANDVKMQVEFNPAQVAAYRLIGYETRMLDRQDFKDDKVDAGDMGAGHTVTAIYEITPAASAGKLVDPLRYGAGRKPAARAKSDELGFVRVRYKLPGESRSRLLEQPVRAASVHRTLASAPLDQRFAVAVAAFGQRLRGEPQLADYSYADIAGLANGARGEDTEGYRAEFVKLVRMTEALGKAGQTGQP